MGLEGCLGKCCAPTTEGLYFVFESPGEFFCPLRDLPQEESGVACLTRPVNYVESAAYCWPSRKPY